MSFIQIKNKSRPNTEPWGTSAKTLSQEGVCPLKTTRCCHKRKKSCIKFKSFPFILYVSNLNINPSYQTLSKNFRNV